MTSTPVIETPSPAAPNNAQPDPTAMHTKPTESTNATKAADTESAVPSTGFPDFSEFVPALDASSPQTIAQLLQRLYTMIMKSDNNENNDNPALKRQAADLLSTYSSHMLKTRAMEQKLLGEWNLRSRNSASLDANNDTIGRLHITGIGPRSGDFEGFLAIGLGGSRYAITGKYKTINEAKVDVNGHLHVILSSKAVENGENAENGEHGAIDPVSGHKTVQMHRQPVNPDLLPVNRVDPANSEHKLELLLHSSGEAIKGEFVPSVEADAVFGFGGEEIESTGIEFTGTRKLVS